MDLIFVADHRNERIQSFRADGTPVRQWGASGVQDGNFLRPSGVAILARSQDRGHPARNLVFVADGISNRIQVYGIHGDFRYGWGDYGQDDGRFDYAAGVAVHPTQDLVYVTDCDNHRVQVFDLEGNFIRKWGSLGSGNGQFKRPSGPGVHPTRDLIFICDYFQHRIQVFRGDGTFLYKWGSYGCGDAQFSYPRSLALHPTRDLVFVTDGENHRVQVFDLNGNFVCKWGSESRTTDGKFYHTTGVAVDPRNERVYVTDVVSRVQVFTLFGTTTNKRKRNK